MKKTFQISPEIKSQILSRIKNDGVSVVDAAKEHGISDKTIYNWLGKGVQGQPTILEMAKLKKENKILLELVGELTLKLSDAQKKK